MGSGKSVKLREGALAGSLFGGIHIHDEPMVPHSIPQTAWGRQRRRPLHQIFLKQRGEPPPLWLD